MCVNVCSEVLGLLSPWISGYAFSSTLAFSLRLMPFRLAVGANPCVPGPSASPPPAKERARKKTRRGERVGKGERLAKTEVGTLEKAQDRPSASRNDVWVSAFWPSTVSRYRAKPIPKTVTPPKEA